MRCVVRPRNSSQNRCGRLCTTSDVVPTPARTTQAPGGCRALGKTSDASERMELSCRPRRTEGHRRPFGKNHLKTFSQAAIVLARMCRFGTRRANLDKRWRFLAGNGRKRGPLQSAVKGVPLIRQQLRSSQRRLPPPNVIHSLLLLK